MALYVNCDNVTYFASFGVEYIPKEIKSFIGNKNVTNIYRIQANDLIVWEYFCIRFIDFTLKVKILLGYTDLFSPSEYEKNDKIIQKNIEYLKKNFMKKF